MRLNDRPRLFVNVLGQVGGIVTKTDLQKPPVRMWLFGMITIIEMGLTRLIEDGLSRWAWRECLSEARLQKAEALLEERKRRNQDLDLLDCLQFSDRGHRLATRNCGSGRALFHEAGRTDRQGTGSPAEQSGPFSGHHRLRLGHHRQADGTPRQVLWFACVKGTPTWITGSDRHPPVFPFRQRFADFED